MKSSGLGMRAAATLVILTLITLQNPSAFANNFSAPDEAFMNRVIAQENVHSQSQTETGNNSESAEPSPLSPASSESNSTESETCPNEGTAPDCYHYETAESCQGGATFVNGQCESYTEANLECPEGGEGPCYSYTSRELSCGEGSLNDSGQCESVTQGELKCSDGSDGTCYEYSSAEMSCNGMPTNSNGKCDAGNGEETEPTMGCPYGGAYESANNTCKTEVSPVLTCPNGGTPSGDQCVTTSEPVIECPNGGFYEGSIDKCRVESSPDTYRCPEGELSGTQCLVKTDPSPNCPNGGIYESANNTCRYTDAPIPANSTADTAAQQAADDAAAAQAAADEQARIQAEALAQEEQVRREAEAAQMTQATAATDIFISSLNVTPGSNSVSGEIYFSGYSSDLKLKVWDSNSYMYHSWGWSWYAPQSETTISCSGSCSFNIGGLNSNTSYVLEVVAPDGAFINLSGSTSANFNTTPDYAAEDQARIQAEALAQQQSIEAEAARLAQEEQVRRDAEAAQMTQAPAVSDVYISSLNVNPGSNNVMGEIYFSGSSSDLKLKVWDPNAYMYHTWNWGGVYAQSETTISCSGSCSFNIGGLNPNTSYVLEVVAPDGTFINLSGSTSANFNTTPDYAAEEQARIQAEALAQQQAMEAARLAQEEQVHREAEMMAQQQAMMNNYSTGPTQEDLVSAAKSQMESEYPAWNGFSVSYNSASNTVTASHEDGTWISRNIDGSPSSSFDPRADIAQQISNMSRNITSGPYFDSANKIWYGNIDWSGATFSYDLNSKQVTINDPAAEQALRDAEAARIAAEMLPQQNPITSPNDPQNPTSPSENPAGNPTDPGTDPAGNPADPSNPTDPTSPPADPVPPTDGQNALEMLVLEFKIQKLYDDLFNLKPSDFPSSNNGSWYYVPNDIATKAILELLAQEGILLQALASLEEQKKIKDANTDPDQPLDLSIELQLLENKVQRDEIQEKIKAWNALQGTLEWISDYFDDSQDRYEAERLRIQNDIKNAEWRLAELRGQTT